VLGVNLPSMDMGLLLLPISLLLLGEESYADCGVAVHSGTIGIVRSARVFFGGGVVVMGTIRVTTLHPRGPGSRSSPPPSPEVALPLSEFLKGGVQGQ
jgi:hypothetical protein